MLLSGCGNGSKANSADSPGEKAAPNFGFEDGEAGWEFTGDAGRSQVLAEAARSGKFGLRVAEPGGKPGALVVSPPFPVRERQGIQLTFQSRALAGRLGCGVYLRFYDEKGRVLNQEVYPYDQDILVPNGAPEKGWMTYTLRSIAPADAVRGNVQVSTWGSKIRLDLDDLQLSTFEPVIAPPYEPSYKVAPTDKARLTAADVVGPDGQVYPDWSRSGVPGGIPNDVKTVVGPETFAALREQDISGALDAAVKQAAAAGGGAIQLPEGKFYLDRPVLVAESRVVIRGAGREKTHLIYRDRVPQGTVRLFNWAGEGAPFGPGNTAEIQANPKDLAALRIAANGKTLAETDRKMHWGNTFQLRVDGSMLLQRLGPGEHEIEGTATYADDSVVTQKFPITVTDQIVKAPASTFNSAIIFGGQGKAPQRTLLSADGKRGDTTLKLAGASYAVGDWLRIVAPATPRWNAQVSNRTPWGLYRAGIFQVTAVKDGEVTLNQPLRIGFPVEDGAYVEAISMLEGCGIEGLTLEQEVITPEAVGKKDSMSGWYSTEDLWTNGVTFSFCRGSWMRDVRVVNAGRNSVYFPNSKFCEVRESEFDNALFKGGGGTAYIGFESSFDCLMDSVVTRKMRHAPVIQWAASGNVVRNSQFYNSDAQFHAGWTNENLLEGNLISAESGDEENGTYGHGVFSSGPSSSEHGPQGPRNVIYNNDIVAQKDGIHMVGGNENWLILYNRVRSGTGYAVYGREKSFDHVLKGNVFIADRPKRSLVYFGAPDCTGIELIGNQFYAKDAKFLTFNGDVGTLGCDEANEVHPAAEARDAALPTPPVPSIYLWQKEHARKPSP
jgi:hypothetical protein